MKKQIIILVTLLLCTMCFNSCSNFDIFSRKAENLIINGVKVDSEYTEVIHKSRISRRILVNMRDLLINLGYEWEKQDNGTISIRKNGQIYLLDSNKEALTRMGENYNLFGERSKATNYTFEIRDDNVIVDSDTLEYAISNLGMQIYIRAFYEDSKVYVISALTESESAIYNTVINGRKLYIPDVFALKPSNDASRSVRVLPLIKTLNECGFNITHNNSEAIIKVGAKTYIVDFQNEKITCDSKNVELDLAISEPELWYQESDGNEMYCSSFIVRALIEYMGHNVYLFDVESGIYIILQDQ